ncbi:cupin domain-containing protein [Bacillus sp. Marseille-Q1617]|uniref:cupin domain-containing protein n=1 Tax=Bacillus sp. Marseille-Q1617 TaxID=2736887 RepID=UPI00158BDF55|nr:cupin domain-containing protein [Bacillus sp. Marseille-Q1617]
MEIDRLKIYYLEDDGTIPNNPDLPVLIYRNAMDDTDEMERIFNHNKWLNSWVNGVHGYHHYHSNAHEVIGVMEGNAKVQLGGDKGVEVTVRKGDVLILPAGTGHKKLSSSPGFRVVGAYPDGAEYNMKEGCLKERPQVLIDIKNVPLPDRDPVYGDKGPIIKYWLQNKTRVNE